MQTPKANYDNFTRFKCPPCLKFEMADSDARYAKHTWIHLDTPGSGSKYVKLHGSSPEFFGWGLIILPWRTHSGPFLIKNSTLDVFFKDLSLRVFRFPDSSTRWAPSPFIRLQEESSSEYIVFICFFFAFTCISTIQNLCSIVRK